MAPLKPFHQLTRGTQPPRPETTGTQTTKSSWLNRKLISLGLKPDPAKVRRAYEAQGSQYLLKGDNAVQAARNLTKLATGQCEHPVSDPGLLAICDEADTVV